MSQLTKPQILMDEQIAEYAARANQRLEETAHKPTEYNAENFTTLSRQLLNGMMTQLRDDTFRETLKIVEDKLDDYFAFHFPMFNKGLKGSLSYEAFWQALNQLAGEK